MSVVDGGLPISVAQKLGMHYPLVNPSVDIRGLLADIYLIHDVMTAAPPLRISRLEHIGQPVGSWSSASVAGSDGSDNPCRIVIVDADGIVIFDGNDGSYTGRAFNDRLYIHEWVVGTHILRVVQHSGQQEDDDQHVWPEFLEPERAIIDERCWHLLPSRVESITVNGVRITEPFTIVGGYNLDLKTGSTAARSGALLRSSTRRRETILRVNTSPGLGEGRYPSCLDTDRDIRTINGVPPDESGNFHLSASGCYYLRRLSENVDLNERTAQFQPNTLKFGNDCESCCTCDDYVNVYRALVRQRNFYKVIGNKAEATRDLFRSMKDRWEAYKACAENNPLNMTLYSTSGLLYILVTICNLKDHCVIVDADIEVAQEGGTPSLQANGIFVKNARSGNWTNGSAVGNASAFRVHWDALDPGHSVCLQATLNVSAALCAPIEVSLSVQFDSVTIDGSLVKSISPICAGNPGGGIVIV